MSKFSLLTISFLIAELLLAFAFAAIAQIYYKREKGLDFKAIFKGAFERIFISVSLIHGLAHAITFFSALKLATRLRHKEEPDEHNKFNDYYLMGNLASVLVAIFYSYAYLHFFDIPVFSMLCSDVHPSK